MTTTRFAPSPTGFLHIGGVRTALYSWLYARQNNGKFILRIEDTDRQRSTQESVAAILDGMHWLGLDYDEGPFYQTERYPRYKEIIEKLISSGHAYHCYCSKEKLDKMRDKQRALKQKPKYDGTCRNLGNQPSNADSVIRFKNPLAGQVVIDDMVRGKIIIDNNELDDLVIARADGTPTYNLTVVVDDLDMGITHVIRGDDHINNTPRQINIFKALGAEPPQYAHVPMILGADGARLSKRHGAVSVLQYQEDGFLPEALLNYLLRLGWSYKDQEIFSKEEMLKLFSITDVNSAPSTFNPEKLLWLNQQYIINSEPELLAEILSWQFAKIGVVADSGPQLAKVVEAQQSRCKTMREMAEDSKYFYQAVAKYDGKAADKNLNKQSLEILQSLRKQLEDIAIWQADKIKTVIKDIVNEYQVGFAKVALPLRVVVTGSASSPSIDLTAELIGKEQVLSRIDAALNYIRENR